MFLVSKKIQKKIGFFLLIISFFFSVLAFLPVFSLASTVSPFSQTDWSGGSGQTDWVDSSKFYSSTDGVDQSTTIGQITLVNSEKFTNTTFESDLSGWQTGDYQWWLSGGISSLNTLAAYAPKYGTSLASSYTNLANPGTYDGTTPTAPTWANGNGWTFNGAFDQYVDTNIIPGNNYTFIIQFDNNSGERPLFGAWDGGGNNIIQAYSNISSKIRYRYGTAAAVNVSPGINSGNIAIAGTKAYRNGNLETSSLSGTFSSASEHLGVGCRLGPGSVPASFSCAWVQVYAFAVYDTVLTGDQIASLYSSMSGLSGASASKDTSTYYAGTASAKIVNNGTAGFNFTQSVNTQDTRDYMLSAYVYTDGSEITSSDAQLVVNGSTISTTYTSAGNGWYLLTGSTAGSSSSVAYGIQVPAGKTVYIDNASLFYVAPSGTLTSSIIDTGSPSTWGNLSYSSTTPANTSVLVKIRSSNQPNLSDAADFSTCNSISSNTDISSNSCVKDGHRYFQYQITLSSSDLLGTPTFESIQLSYSSRESTPSLESPGDKSYTNSERPLFKWKTATDASSNLSSYSIEVDNGKSGDFVIQNIPVSRTTDWETAKYLAHYENFFDTDNTNNYISVYTKSNTEWGVDQAVNGNDGKLKEGKRSWKLKTLDSSGVEYSEERTLLVDRTPPNVELLKINSSNIVSDIYQTKDFSPTIQGNVVDPLSLGDESTSLQNEYGPRVASGPKKIDIEVQRKTGYVYKTVSAKTLDFQNIKYTCNDQIITDNTKQECAKYQTFSFKPDFNLSQGVYKITFKATDSADNASIAKPLYLQVTHDPVSENDTQENSDAEKETIPLDSKNIEIFEIVSEPTSSPVIQNEDYSKMISESILGSLNAFINNAAILLTDFSKTSKETIANYLFILGEKTQGWSDSIGLAVIQFTYNFVSEPTTISNVKTKIISPTAVEVSWSTNHPASGKVNWGLEEGIYTFEKQTSKKSFQHAFELNDLMPGTQYFFEVLSHNKNFVFDARRIFVTPKD